MGTTDYKRANHWRHSCMSGSEWSFFSEFLTEIVGALNTTLCDYNCPICCNVHGVEFSSNGRGNDDRRCQVSSFLGWSKCWSPIARRGPEADYSVRRHATRRNCNAHTTHVQHIVAVPALICCKNLRQIEKSGKDGWGSDGWLLIIRLC